MGPETDLRRRPVVLHTTGAAAEPPRRARRYLAWAGTGLLGVVAAAGLVAGGTAVWSAFDPGTPGRSPAPLWFSPPETIAPRSEKPTPTPTPTSTRTIEPGDDKGGLRGKSPRSTGTSTSGGPSTSSGTSTSGNTGTGSSDDRSGKSGSGKSSGKSASSSSDDGPNHH